VLSRQAVKQSKEESAAPADTRKLKLQRPSSSAGRCNLYSNHQRSFKIVKLPEKEESRYFEMRERAN
jgi:hypothetical protein